MKKPAKLAEPQVFTRGTKVAVYGQWGTGKTEFMMSVVEVARLFVVDTEGRTQYYDPTKGHGFEVVYSKDPKDMLEVLTYAEHLNSKGERAAFGLDSMTGIWFEQQEVAERLGTNRAGQVKFGNWNVAKKPLKAFYARMFASPIDIVVTVRAKPRYEQEQSGKVIDYGYDVPDAERGFAFAPDLVLEFAKKDVAPGTPLSGDHFYAVVTKTSGPKENNPLPTGKVITDPSFAKVANLRLEGVDRVMQFEAGVGYQVAMASVTTSAQLVKWAETNLGWTQAQTVKNLTETFGKLDPNMLDSYRKHLYEVAAGKETNDEA